MGRSWVYRRPHFRVAKPKIPLFRRGTPLFPQRRRFFRRRRLIASGRAVAIAAILGKTAAVGRVVIGRHRVFIRPHRPGQAHNKIILRKTATAGKVFSRAVGLRRFRRPLRRRAPKRILTPPSKFTGKTGVFARALKAILRMRRQIRARLRWKPRDIPPEIEPPFVVVISNPRGSIFSGGSTEGDVFSAGAKRGSIY